MRYFSFVVVLLLVAAEPRSLHARANFERHLDKAAAAVLADLAEQGSIRQTTPTTFSAPATIQDWNLKSLSLRPGSSASIAIELVAATRPDVTLTFEYPRDCGSFGADAQGNPNPPTCPSRDTSAEIDALITTLNTVNLATRSLWRRVFDNLCADFPSKFPGGCVVQ